MINWMTHFVYFHFHLTSKIFSLISLNLISLFSYWKRYSWKDTSPNFIEFSKNQTRIGRFAWSQKSLFWTLLLITQEKWVGSNREKTASVSWWKRRRSNLGNYKYCFSRCWKPETRSYIGTHFWQGVNCGSGACQLQQSVWHSTLQ